jgi:hypothetical protein
MVQELARGLELVSVQDGMRDLRRSKKRHPRVALLPFRCRSLASQIDCAAIYIRWSLLQAIPAGLPLILGAAS